MHPSDIPTPHLATLEATEPPLSREAFESRLREKGTSYHIHHPIHVMMAEGKLTQAQIQRWVANRYLYQVAIPVKDANILANCPDREIRREWIQRILDHDGYAIGGAQDDGGIEAWIRLGEAVGLTREDITSERLVAPAARFAVDAYVTFARNRPWQDAVASSLTELFAPHIHQQRLDTWPDKYPWIETGGLQYFRNRLTQARRDVAHGLRFTLDYFGQNRALQQRALDILQFKLDVLWSLADAILLQTCEIEIKGPKV
jgi:pyrroloquinoline-quinone synthase